MLPPPDQGGSGMDAVNIEGEGPRWQRTLWTMVGVQFVMSIAFSILSPIMPLLLPQLGVASREAVDVWAGVLASVTSFVAIFTAPIWGGLADRYGRKLMVLRSTLGIAMFTALMGLALSPWHMLALRAGMGGLAGFNSAATVLVATQVPEQRLGYSLGWLGTGQLVGSLIGPLIGGVVADLTGSYRMPFFFAGAISLVAFLGTLWFVPERFVPPAGGRQKHSFLAGISLLIRTAGLVPLIVVMLMAQFATQAVQPVVTLFVQEMLGSPGILGHRHRRRAGGAVSRQEKRRDRLPGGAADQPVRSRPVHTAAGVPARVLGVRGGTLRARPVRRRHPAGGECADRAADDIGQPWLRVRHGVVGVFRRQHAGTADRRGDCGHRGDPICVRCHRGAAAGQSGLGVSQGARGRRAARCLMVRRA
jgi:hypothetical protein